MKRVEVVIKSSAVDTFIEAAASLGIFEYDVSDVRLSPRFAFKECRRLYRGQEYTRDLLSGIKVEFVARDDDARQVAENLVGLIAPERVAIFSLDEIISITASPIDTVSRTTSQFTAPLASATH
jgi:nitrogen regulatory protein PII